MPKAMGRNLFEIVEKKLLAPAIYMFRVYSPWVAENSNPGQFIILKTDEKGERIPLTIADYDRENGLVTVVIQAIGHSTEDACSYNVGEKFNDFVGPLGQASDLINQTDEELKGKKILFVAGGLGAAPVYPQVKYLHSRGIDADVIMGAKTKEMIIYEEDMKKVANNVFVVTDDGSYGNKGFVTDEMVHLIENEGKKYDEVIAIGPLIMMKSVSELTKKYNIKTIVSLNPIMVDGTGMCGACRITVGNSVKFACVDGPEFEAHEIDFDEALKRQKLYKTVEGKKLLNITECEQDKRVELGTEIYCLGKSGNGEKEGEEKQEIVIHKENWGSFSLFQVFAKFFFTYGEQYDNFYWFLIVKGHKTYKILPTFLKKFYPNFKEDTPPEMKSLMDFFGHTKYPGEYNPIEGIIEYNKLTDSLKEGIADISNKELRDDHVKFFLKKNPHYESGNDLVCIASLKKENLRERAKRLLL